MTLNGYLPIIIMWSDIKMGKISLVIIVFIYIIIVCYYVGQYVRYFNKI